MTDPLVRADELRALIGAVTVLDVRYRLGGPSGLPEFAAGHVSGAAYVDLDRDLADPPGDGGRHPLPDPARFAAAMRAAGVSGSRPVVVYDDWGARAASRCWWLLRHHGHDDVRVLDGGWPAWVAAGGPVETGTGTGDAKAEPGDFTAGPGRLPVLESGDVRSFAGRLVDARAPERFRGDVEPVDPVAGHDAACPSGIDVYFENVGGAVQAAVFPRLNEFGRMVMCGMVSEYNDIVPGSGPNLMSVVRKRLKIQGFIVGDHRGRAAEFQSVAAPLVKSGQLKYREHIVDGLDHAPAAFIGLLQGENFGKLLVRLGPG